MLSAYSNDNETVMVAINYTKVQKEINVELKGSTKKKVLKYYRTTAGADDNMKPYPLSSLSKITLEPRSISTIIVQR